MRGYAAIGLDNPKCGANVGSVLRAAGCYDASLVVASGARINKVLKYMPTDTQKAYRHLPLQRIEDLREAIPYDCVPVAVDLIEGATRLDQYIHPERAFYIFGAEDATLGTRTTNWCRDVIYIPTNYCMNLAATVNVVLYARACQKGFPKKEN